MPKLSKNNKAGKYIRIDMAYGLKLMYDVASLYYEDNLKQESVARRLNISKYKVSRVLKRAVEEGIVQIRIIEIGDKTKKIE